MVTLVVGCGPIGSSIASQLSSHTSVVLIGPHKSSYCSHNDRGRLSRVADAEGSLKWCSRNKRALQMYGDLEVRSGVKFYYRCGSLFVMEDELLSPVRSGLDRVGTKYETLSNEELRQRFKYLNIPPGRSGVYEPEAGFINPLSLVEANKTILVSNGGRYVDDSVVSFSATKNTVTLTSGEVMEGERIVVACGGYTESVLLSGGLTMGSTHRISKRTVALVPVDVHVGNVGNVGDVGNVGVGGSSEVVDGCLNMPGLKFQLGTEDKEKDKQGTTHDFVEGSCVYVLPPIEYPERECGRAFIKIGGGANEWIDDITNTDELEEFLRGSGDPLVLKILEKQLRMIMAKEISLGEAQAKTCFTCCSLEGDVCVKNFGNVIAVLGCEGKGAGPSLAIGEEVVEAILGIR